MGLQTRHPGSRPLPALLWALRKDQASPFPSPGLQLQGCSAGQFEAQSPSRQGGQEGGGTPLFPPARHDGPRQPTGWAEEQPPGLSTGGHLGAAAPAPCAPACRAGPQQEAWWGSSLEGGPDGPLRALAAARAARPSPEPAVGAPPLTRLGHKASGSSVEMGGVGRDPRGHGVGSPQGCQHCRLPPGTGVLPRAILAVGRLQALSAPARPGYLQGQLQTQVLRVTAEHSPRGAEEEAAHHAVLVLDVSLPGRGLRESLGCSMRVHVRACGMCGHLHARVCTRVRACFVGARVCAVSVCVCIHTLRKRCVSVAMVTAHQRRFKPI